MGYTQSATPIFNSTAAPFNVTKWDISWMGSVSYTGTVISVIICFLIGDKIGRKVFIASSAVTYLFIWSIFLLTSSSLVIIIGLVFYGISSGMTIIIGSIYIGEVASPQNREVFGIFTIFATVLGTGLEFLISNFYNYRLLTIFPLVITCITLLFLYTMRESPYYLLANNESAEALIVQAWLNGRQSEGVTQEEFRQMVRYVQSNEKSKGKLADMFERKNLKIIGVMMFLSGSMVVNSGNVTQQYGQKVIEEFSHFMNLAGFVTIFNIISLCGAIAGLFTIKLIRRQTLLIIGFWLLFLTQLLIGLLYYIEWKYNNMLENVAYTIAGLHCLTLFLSLSSCKAGLIVLRSEIFPSHLKAPFSALSALTKDVAAFGIVKWYIALVEKIGAEWVLAMYALINMMSALLVFFFIEDTKNKSLYEIQNKYEAEMKKNALG